MRITAVEAVPTAPRWVFVRVETDAGLVGVGEALGDKGLVVAQAVRELARYLEGKDPGQIELHWQAMYRGAFWRGGPILNAAISGVEQALWDLLGKSLGVPVYALLGGKCRERVRVYGHIGGATPEAVAEQAAQRVAAGITAVKWCPVPATRPVDSPALVREAVAQVAAVRERVGDTVDILLDLHGRLSPAMAIWIADELRPYRPMFLEEPCLPENVDAMARIARATPIPIATGERLFTKFGFREVLEKQAAAVIQPDLCICGGILEGKKIAAMAEAYYVAVAPHNPYGPVNTAASVQLDACTPNFLIQEFSSLGEGVLKEPLRLVDGHLEIPTGPGLGIEVDWEAVRARPFVAGDVPLLLHEDGSVADW